MTKKRKDMEEFEFKNLQTVLKSSENKMIEAFFGKDKTVPYALLNACLRHVEKTTEIPQTSIKEKVEISLHADYEYDGKSYGCGISYPLENVHCDGSGLNLFFGGISNEVRAFAQENLNHLRFLENEEDEEIDDDELNYYSIMLDFADYLDTLEMTGEEQKEYERFKLFCKMQPLKQKAQDKLKQMGGE